MDLSKAVLDYRVSSLKPVNAKQLHVGSLELIRGAYIAGCHRNMIGSRSPAVFATN